MGKDKIMIPSTSSVVKVLGWPFTPCGWPCFAVTVALFDRDGGPKTPCKWTSQNVIYVTSMSMRFFPNPKLAYLRS